MKQPIDYMRPSAWKRVQIKDRTHKNGIPTFINMERRLKKEMQYA